MTTQTIERVEIFSTGEHNGLSFDVADLEAIRESFEREGLAGRVPVKLGHHDDSTQPAAGWLSKVWREGERLIATVTDVPADVVQAIKEGRWRFCSVELMQDVKTAAGRSYRWLLSALAFLGAAPPAVQGLRPLHESLSRRAAGLSFGQRLAFTRELPATDELTRLRTEVQRLTMASHRQSIEAAISQDIATGRVLPAAREHFYKLMRLGTDSDFGRVTAQDWQTFRSSQPRGPSREPAARVGSVTSNATRPDAELVERIEIARRDQPGLTYFDAQLKVLRSDPDLAERYRSAPGTI